VRTQEAGFASFALVHAWPFAWCTSKKAQPLYIGFKQSALRGLT